jgi:hypothetical protein
MAGTATAPAPGASGAAQGQQAPPPSAPFRAGTIRTLTTDGYSVTSSALGAGTQQLTPYTPSPNSYIRGVWLNVSCTTASNAATVAFNADAPFNAIQNVVFQDANQKPIVGPFDGYTLMVVNKYGGYQAAGDPRASATYSVTSGVGSGAGGSFNFNVYVPLEIASRDTLGALQNKSSSSTFQLVLTINTSSAVYSTAPTTTAGVTVTVHEDGWIQPKATDLSGTPLSQSPPQLGTTQYWTRGSYQALNGSTQVQLTQGLGYPIRNFMAVLYGVSAGTRAAGDGFLPNPTQFIYKGTSIFNVTQPVWKDQMSRMYGFTNTTADAANGLENGVYVPLFLMSDFGLGQGDELRNAYLASQQGDQFQLIGSFSGNTNLYWVANYVAPAGGPSNLASIRAGR